ncbi:MAG: helix-turn-helix transcriptional regulator, partial [Gemmiger sp.]|nr:helix-turn-helix transcriptional regulator [Gemmiger sp.]
MTFGESLRQIREERGMTQEQLAEFLGTTKQVISRYETGQRVPKLTVAQEYARRLGVTLDRIAGDPGAQGLEEL